MCKLDKLIMKFSLMYIISMIMHYLKTLKVQYLKVCVNYVNHVLSKISNERKLFFFKWIDSLNINITLIQF